jgi:hypothetical protein
MSGVKDYSVIASGYLAVDKILVAGGGAGPGGVLHGVELISNGTNTCNVIVYHGTSAISGNEVAGLVIAATTAAPTNIIFNNPIACPDGIFVHPTGTGVNCIIYYSLGA